MKPVEKMGISPAPWFYHDNDKRKKGPPDTVRPDWIEAHDRFAVCDFDRWEYRPERTVADARLIAAAPELYEALRLCMAETCRVCKERADRPCVELCETVRMARAALEKAGGATK